MKINEYELSCENKRRYTKLDTVKVLGKDYDLVVEYKLIKTPSLNFEKNEIQVSLPLSFKKMENSQTVTTIMEKMYEKLAEKEIENAMEKTRVLLDGIAPEDYSIERMKNPLTLAKCIDNKIIVNPDIVMHNRKLIEYIILHEFCHLKYKNHTKAFYNMIKTYMPDYEKIAKGLNGIAY